MASHDPSQPQSSVGRSLAGPDAGLAAGSAGAGSAAAAAAPKDETLYETLLRYHNEQDDTSLESNEIYNVGEVQRQAQQQQQQQKPPEGAARQGIAQGTGTHTSSDVLRHGDGLDDDRKLPAVPASGLVDGNGTQSPNGQWRQAPLTPNARALVDAAGSDGRSVSPYHSPFREVGDSPSSFYKAALEEASRAEGVGGSSLHHKPKSPSVPAKPGAVMVHEPAIRPDSVMYRAACGDDSSDLRSGRSGSPSNEMSSLSASRAFHQHQQAQPQHQQTEAFPLVGASHPPFEGLARPLAPPIHYQPPPAPSLAAHLVPPRNQAPVRQRSLGAAGQVIHPSLNQPALSHPPRQSPTSSPYRRQSHPQQTQQHPVQLPPPMGPDEVRRTLAALRQSKVERQSESSYVTPSLSASSSRDEDTSSSMSQGRRSPTFPSAAYDPQNTPRGQQHVMAKDPPPHRRISPVRHVSPMHSSASAGSTASQRPTPGRSISPGILGGNNSPTSHSLNSTTVHPGELMDFGSDAHIRATQQRHQQHQQRRSSTTSSRPSSSRASSPARSVASTRAPSSRGSSPVPAISCQSVSPMTVSTTTSTQWASHHSAQHHPTQQHPAQQHPAQHHPAQQQQPSSSHSVGPHPPTTSSTHWAPYPTQQQLPSSSHSVGHVPSATTTSQRSPSPAQQQRYSRTPPPRAQSPMVAIPQEQYSPSISRESDFGRQYHHLPWSSSPRQAAESSLPNPGGATCGRSDSPSHASGTVTYVLRGDSEIDTASVVSESRGERQYRDFSSIVPRREVPRPAGKPSRNISAPSVSSTVAMMRSEFARSRSNSSLMFSIYSGSSRSNLSNGEHNNYNNYDVNNQASNQDNNQDNNSDDSSLDEDFKLALELSLRESNNVPTSSVANMIQNVGAAPHSPYPHGGTARQDGSNQTRYPSRSSPPPSESHSPPKPCLVVGEAPHQHSSISAAHRPGLHAPAPFGHQGYRAPPEPKQSSGMDDYFLALKLSAEEEHRLNPPDKPYVPPTGPTFQLPSTSDTISSPAGPVATSTNVEPDEQYRILQEILEEQERKELELALRASQEDASASTVDAAKNLAAAFEVSAVAASAAAAAASLDYPSSFPHSSSADNLIGVDRQGSALDFLKSQQLAMEEYQRSRSLTAPTHSASSSTNSVNSATRQVAPGSGQDKVPSASSGQRHHILERGIKETQEAISSGQARIVQCRGCNGRLQAPMSYSLVFCPKCETISPA